MNFIIKLFYLKLRLYFMKKILKDKCEIHSHGYRKKWGKK